MRPRGALVEGQSTMSGNVFPFANPNAEPPDDWSWDDDDEEDATPLLNALPRAEPRTAGKGGQTGNPLAFDPSAVVSLAPLLDRGRKILRDGVPFVVEGMIPAYGGVGFYVARPKVGKTSLGLHLLSSISSGRAFLGRKVERRKVLMLALEDPQDYLAVLTARAFKGDEDAKFYPRSLVLNEQTLNDLGDYIRKGGFQFLYVATFLHAVRGLVKDENDNAGMVAVIASLKAFARDLEVPTLFEAHAGKGEDQSEDADPLMSLRGASAAAGEADYVLNMKRKRGGFSTTRVLSGLGRFVEFQPVSFNRNADGSLTVLDGGNSAGAAETDFQMLLRADGGLSEDPKSAAKLATAVGWVRKNGKPDKNDCGRVHRALLNRQEVDAIHSGTGRGGRTAYRINKKSSKIGAAG
jgi:AAA domain